MEIVKAEPQDAKPVAAICSSAISSVYPRWYPQGAVSFFLNLHSEENIAKDIQEGKVFVCKEEGAAVATVTVSGNEIHRLFVLDGWRGRGYGKALLDFAEPLALAGHSAVRLESSLPARALYIKRGYVARGFFSEQTESGDFLCWLDMEKRAEKKPLEPSQMEGAISGASAYDDRAFFEAYSKMERSIRGLEGAGEWHQLKRLFPADLTGASVLDLGCGYGWHCKHAESLGAAYVLGVDSSKKMIEAAKAKNAGQNIFYINAPIEEYEWPRARFDLVVSNLALHYIEDIAAVFKGIAKALKPGGAFILNIEHPVFTAGVNQEWARDSDGKPLYWPVDGYFFPGARQALFLGRQVTKQHHTLAQIAAGLLDAGFAITALEEATPSAEALRLPEMQDELRRPMMLLIRAELKG